MGDAELERGGSGHAAAAAPLAALSEMISHNPVILRSSQRPSQRQAGRSGALSREAFRRLPIYREHDQQQMKLEEQRKEEELQALKQSGMAQQGFQTSEKLPPLSHGGRHLSVHRPGHADPLVQRERDVRDARMQLGIPLDSSAALRGYAGGKSPPVDFHRARSTAQRDRLEMQMSPQQIEGRRMAEQLELQNASASTGERARHAQATPINLPPLSTTTAITHSPSAKKAAARNRANAKWESSWVDDEAERVQSWHDLSNFSGAMDRKQKKIAMRSQSVPQLGVSDVFKIGAQRGDEKTGVEDVQEGHHDAVDERSTATEDQARHAAPPIAIQQPLNAAQILKEPKRLRTFQRMGETPKPESFAPKSTYSNKAEELEFRRLAQRRQLKLTKQQQRVKSQQERYARLEAAERHEQKRLDDKQAKLPPKPMDKRKLRIQENALRNHEMRVAEHDTICAKVADKVNRPGDALLMRISGEAVERTQMTTAIAGVMPVYDDRRRYLRGAEFFHQRHLLGTETQGIYMSPTMQEIGKRAEPELIGKPLDVPGNTDVTKRKSRWAAAPYTSLVWSNMEKLLWEVNGILEHKPDIHHLSMRGSAMSSATGPRNPNMTCKWVTSTPATGTGPTLHRHMELPPQGGWRPRSTPARMRASGNASGQSNVASRGSQAPSKPADWRILQAVNDRRRAEGKKPIVRLPTHWRQLASNEGERALTCAFARKDGHDRTNVRVVMEDYGGGAGVAEIKDIRRWQPYRAWYGGRPVGPGNPVPTGVRTLADPEGLAPRLDRAVPRLTRSKKTAQKPPREQPADRAGKVRPEAEPERRASVRPCTADAAAGATHRSTSGAGTQPSTARKEFLDTLVSHIMQRHQPECPSPGEAEAGSQVVDSVAAFGESGDDDGRADAGDEQSDVFKTLSHGLMSESARMNRLKRASAKIQEKRLELHDPLDQSPSRRTSVTQLHRARAGAADKRKFRLAGNRIFLEEERQRPKERKQVSKPSSAKGFWSPDADAQMPKILVGEQEFLFTGEPENIAKASCEPCQKKIVVYGEATAGDIVLLPLPFHNHGETRVDFELTELVEENVLGTKLAENKDVYSIFCQQCHRITVEGDTGDILFGFSSSRPGLFRKTYGMFFTPRLESGQQVLVEVFGHVLEAPRSIEALKEPPLLNEEVFPVAPAESKDRAGEYRNISLARRAFESQLEVAERERRLLGVPYQLSEVQVEQEGDREFMSAIVEDLISCVASQPRPVPMINRLEEEEIVFALNPTVHNVHMDLLNTLETIHCLMSAMPEVDGAGEGKLPEASPKTARAAEGKTPGGLKSAKAGKPKDKEKEKDKKGGAGKAGKEPVATPDQPRVLQMKINPHAVWDYRIPSLHELVLTPDDRPEEDHMYCAKLYEDLSVKMGETTVADDSGDIRADLATVHERTTSFVRLLLEGLVDAVSDTCTTLRRQMHLPMGDVGDDAAKDAVVPGVADKGARKGAAGAQKKPELAAKLKKDAKVPGKDNKKKDAGKGKTKSDGAAGSKQDVAKAGSVEEEEGKTLVDPEKLQWFRDLACLQVRDKTNQMFDDMTTIEPDIEPDILLPDFEPMLSADLNIIADPIDVGDVFGSIHDVACVLLPRKPKTSADMFKALMSATAMDRTDIYRRPERKMDRAKVDPSKQVRFET